MKTNITFRRIFFAFSMLGCGIACLNTANAQVPRDTRPGISQPVYRVTNNNNNTSGPQRSPFGGPQQTAQAPVPQYPATQAPVRQHPLDPALDLARRGLKNIQTNVVDYTATLVKRERINGKLGEQEFMFVKIRNRKIANNRIATPLSVYMKFLAPKDKAGREVIYVEGQNGNKLLGHEVPGIRNLITAKLDPNGYFAMMGQRYPLTEIGIENLVAKLIEDGERDRKYDEVEVKFFKGAKINDRVCTLLQVTHPNARPQFSFHIAQIFIDDELQVPVRYAAYTWPTTPGGKPVLDEEYTYMNIKLNVGLKDVDFDPKNKNYKFP